MIDSGESSRLLEATSDQSENMVDLFVPTTEIYF